jgi:hypothetical protein
MEYKVGINELEQTLLYMYMFVNKNKIEIEFESNEKISSIKNIILEEI